MSATTTDTTNNATTTWPLQTVQQQRIVNTEARTRSRRALNIVVGSQHNTATGIQWINGKQYYVIVTVVCVRTSFWARR